MAGMDRRFRNCRLLSIFLVTLALPCFAYAQEQNPPGNKGNPASSDSSDKTQNKDVESANPLGAAWSNTYIRQIGTAGLLAGNPTGLHWGRFYIPTADVRGVVDKLDESNGQINDVLVRTLFEGTMVYDREFKRNRFSIQYRPRLAIADGHVLKDFSSQNTSLEMIVYSRPRWSVRVGDAFQYYYTQQSMGNLYFDVDSITSTTLTNSFVDGPGRWLSNSASVHISYAISQRSSISVSPRYSYVESGVGANFNLGQLYGGDVSFNYQTSARQTVGLEYSSQVIHRTSNSGSDSIYQTVGGLLERQFSPGFLVKGALGMSTASFGGNSRQWYVYGNFGLVRIFSRSSLALSFSRGDSFSDGLISDQFNDRIDLTYRAQLNRRLTLSLGGGYLRETVTGGFEAKYADAQMDLLAAPKFSLYLFAGYARKNQGTNSFGLFAGDQDLVTFGLRWQPTVTNRQKR